MGRSRNKAPITIELACGHDAGAVRSAVEPDPAGTGAKRHAARSVQRRSVLVSIVCWLVRRMNAFPARPHSIVDGMAVAAQLEPGEVRRVRRARLRRRFGTYSPFYQAKDGGLGAGGAAMLSMADSGRLAADRRPACPVPGAFAASRPDPTGSGDL